MGVQQPGTKRIQEEVWLSGKGDPMGIVQDIKI